jgi:hypothetical protein
MFSDINGHLPAEQKLVVLDDDASRWRQDQVRLLSSVAYVGTWSDRDRWTEFVWSGTAEGRLLMEPEHTLMD